MNVPESKLAEVLAECAAYRGTELYALFVRMMDSIEACYKEDLLTVKPEDLKFKQGAAAQVRSIRKALIESGVQKETNFHTPKV